MNIRLLCTALLCVVAAGCQHRRPVVQPLAPEAVQSIRESYLRVDPSTRVGTVIAALPEKGLVAVGQLPVNEFKEGDVLVFVDTSRQVIAAGKVVAKTTDALHVSYDVRGANGREPQVGDLAVHSGH